MKPLIPRDFNLYWVKNTSLKYKITDENIFVYEYIFNFLVFSLFSVFCIVAFCEIYMADVPFSSLQLAAYIKFKKFLYVIVLGTVFSLNFLFFSINKKNLSKIRLVIKECTFEEKNTLYILRSYYRLLLFLNTILCFSVIIYYTRYMFNVKIMSYIISLI